MEMNNTTAKARNLAARLETKARDIAAVDNNPLFDTDPRENFVSVETSGWECYGHYNDKGETLDFFAETLCKGTHGNDPGVQESIVSDNDGNTKYQEKIISLKHDDDQLTVH